MDAEASLQSAVAGDAMRERESQPLGRRARGGDALRRFDLRQDRRGAGSGRNTAAELGMAIEAEAANHQAVEMAEQEIGEVERAGLVVGHGLERGAAGEEFVAMGAGNALDVLFAQHGVEQAARAAIAVGHEDRRVAVAIRADRVPHGARDALRAIVQFRGQAPHVEMRPVVRRRNAAISRASAPQAITSTEGAVAHARQPVTRATRIARRMAISALAVSTAIAASRQ